MNATISCSLAILLGVSAGRASVLDALAISANIQARHLPFTTLLDPLDESSSSDRIVGYTRCGDSALWTGVWLAAESFRYKVTQSADALQKVKTALAGLKGLADVTGDNRLARCMVPASSPYAAGISNEEANNSIHQNPPWIWIDNTSRDQVVGVFFGLGVAFDLVDDPDVKAGASDLLTRLIGFISRHQWSPNDDLSSTFELRPEELQMLLQVARHANPSNTVSGPFIVLPVSTGVLFDVQSNSSYFKFNLDYLTFYHLVRLQDNGDNRGAYGTLRNYTTSHQNALFNMVDRALRGPDPVRDAETRELLDQWLQRPKRDFTVDVSAKVAVCGSAACQPVPVAMRPPATFLWEVDPFQLKGGGSGIIENAGVDYILPYWMARYYGVIDSDVHSAAAPSAAIAPASLASLFGQSLAPATAQAAAQPLPVSLGGITLTVKDSAGVSQSARLLYVSQTQINFLVPDNVAAGAATLTVSGGAAPLNFTADVLPIAPTLFSMSGTGAGVAAALAVAVQAANPQVQSPVPVFQCAGTSCTSVPISLTADRPVYVSFYGTGIRNRSAPENVTVTVNGTSLPVLYAGPSPDYAGLDQVNVALPLTLRGSGESRVFLTMDGQTSNVVTINVQ
ncbi:MAG: hypothetical protein JWP63_6073 [Candidatus Solibacter sp.]|nr:hypothetical protein [Candidatus Solibacter sp.]